jgi:hypothetical protein
MLLVPISCLTRADAVQIRLVQSENSGEFEFLLACHEFGDGRRVTIQAALHSNESKAAVSVGRRRGIGLIIVTACALELEYK